MKVKILEGCIVKWKKYPKDEVKVRVARPGPLGVPKDLWWLWKDKKITWEDYESRYLLYVMKNEKAHDALLDILRLLKAGVTVRLMCYEKNPPCHRFTLKNEIESLFEKETGGETQP